MAAREEGVRAASDVLRDRPKELLLPWAAGARRECVLYRVLRFGLEAVWYFEAIFVLLVALRTERSGGGSCLRGDGGGGGKWWFVVDVVSVSVDDIFGC